MPAPAAITSGKCRVCAQPVTGELAGGLCVGCLSARLTGDDPIALFPSAGIHVPPGYELVEVLGRGGMGEVFLVFQKNLSRYVALKQLAGRRQDDVRGRERFLREAQAAARLSHPGIVPILEIGSDATPLWYTMEYVDGGDLARQLTRRGGSLPWREAVTLVRAVAQALEHAHRAGIAHRDLKPSNILIDADGKPRVADFGLAWLASREGDDLTATGEVLGTPAYLAPESVSGSSRTMDPRRGDIYSLGAVLFHLVAGRPPFEGAHAMEVLGAIARSPAPALSSVARGEVPDVLDDVCATCLQKDPARRFSTARELIAALDACLGGGKLSLARWAMRRARRGWPVGLALAGVGLAMVAQRWRHGAEDNGAAVVAQAAPLVAVLPIEALDGAPAANLLAQGLQEELVAMLTRLTDLRVLAARTMPKSGIDDPRQARVRLGADALLAAKLRQLDDKIWVSVQWIDTVDGTTRWSRTYTRERSNALNLQTDIATDIAVQLHARLRNATPDAQRGTTSASADAQDRFVRARRLATDASDSVGQLAAAEALLREAVALDPSFALAYAQLSLVDTQMYNWGNDRTERRLALGLEAAQTAVRLNPNLAEAEIALGHYYSRGSRDFATARPHLNRALALSPHNSAALEALGHVERRAGNFQAAAKYLAAARELDPLNPILAYNAADTFLRLREYAQAATILDRALSLMPGHVALVKLRGDLMVAWKGDLSAMREDIEHRNPALPTPDLYTMDKIEYLTLAHRLDEAIAALRASRLTVLEGQSIYLVRDGYEALLLALAGRVGEAQAAAQRALPVVKATLAQRPNDPRVVMHAAQLTAIVGDIDGAERAVQRILTPADPAHADAFDRGLYLRERAIMLALAGRDAHEAIRATLADPNQTSVHYIRLHPALARYAKDFP